MFPELPVDEQVWSCWIKEMGDLYSNKSAKEILTEQRDQFRVHSEYTLYEQDDPDNKAVDFPSWVLVHKNSVMVMGISVDHVHWKQLLTHLPSTKVVSGKRHRGAIQCHPVQNICTITLRGSLDEDAEHVFCFHIKYPILGHTIDSNTQFEKLLNTWIQSPKLSTNDVPWLVMVAPQSRSQIKKSLSLLEAHQFKKKDMFPFSITSRGVSSSHDEHHVDQFFPNIRSQNLQ